MMLDNPSRSRIFHLPRRHAREPAGRFLPGIAGRAGLKLRAGDYLRSGDARKGPVRSRTGPFRIELLVFLLALFSGFRAGPRGFGFGFLLARGALGVGLVLLRLALFDEVVATCDGSANLFDLAFDAFDGALDGLLWSALVIPHGSTSLSMVRT